MTSLRFIEIDGKRHLWRDILKLRREQRAAYVRAQQPVLFELKHDCRPSSSRTAASRYLEPSLFERSTDLTPSPHDPRKEQQHVQSTTSRQV